MAGNHLAGSQEVKASYKGVSPTETKGRTSELLLSSEQFKTEKLKDRDNIYTIMAPANRTRMALLITNVRFDRFNHRDGAEKDEQDMSKLLISLGYNVEQHRDLSGAEMDEAVKRFSKDPRLAATDSVFVVIMSHGVKGAILGVHHCDGDPDQFPIDNIYKHLDSAHCPKLLNKPKVIIIQACRGVDDGSAIVCDGPGSVPEQAPVVQVDAALPPHLADEVDADIEEDAIHRVHKEKDFISLLYTVSYRQKSQGSFLIQHIVEIFNRHAHKDHIDELFRKVLKRFEDEPPSADTRQMAVKERSTLTRMFYLFPGPDLSDKQLLEVAQRLGQEWEPAAIHLGLKTEDLEAIKAKHRSVAMQKLQMLVLWKRRRPPGEATALDLLEGLKDLEDLPDNTPLSLIGELQRIRSEFVTIVTTSVIKGLLNDLWQQHVFSTEETEYMMEDFTTSADMARCLIKMVIGKGERASHIMIDSMKKRDPDLCSTLGLISSPAGVGHGDDKMLVKPKEPTFLSRGELQRIRLEFVKRVTTSVIKGLLDDLLQQHVFSTEEKDYMMEDFSTRADRARCLIDMVMTKGERASHIMIDGMKKRDHHLCSTLGLISSPAGVGRNLSDKQLRKVSEMLGQEWELVAIHLELTTIDLDVIKADRQTDVAMQKYKMLVRWRGQRPPGEATAQDLLRGLEDLGDLPFKTRLLLTDYWTGEELPNLLERFLNQFQRSNENESHMHAVSSTESNTPGSAPQLPQATEEEDTPYPMKAQPKGYCLIVNNFDFSDSGRNLGQRMGTDIDKESLRSVFSWLGFKVKVLRDLTRAQMLSSMRELASRDHSWMDCVACVVLSHGLEGGVYGVDGKVVQLKELADFLNGVRCASLRGKPKLFFIQACQGNKREQAVPVLDNRPAPPEVNDQTDGPSSTGDHTQTDGPSSTGDHTQTDGPSSTGDHTQTDGPSSTGDHTQTYGTSSTGDHTQTYGPSSTGDPCSDAVEEWIPTSADFLTAMATTPSYLSMRDEDQGSWFIQSLCHNLVKLVPGGKDLARILTTVNKNVSKKSNRIGGRRQMPQHQTSLRTDLVFPVPEDPPPRLPTSP
ncbi:uncharacterized protein LOC115560663 isoform X3 [Gadus morhua]|uniref:uncharacterized protein LOC115560663 isoform X3 n=1 Tax=Gadus morhua TaxID=8049 RepID=UPI0011B4B25A|nr:uncharacterized protein LOC115560663 isoform X3 [Gadus morhua]